MNEAHVAHGGVTTTELAHVECNHRVPLTAEQQHSWQAPGENNMYKYRNLTQSCEPLNVSSYIRPLPQPTLYTG